MRITVIGTGYVGLVTGTCFAESGNHVVCVDIDSRKIENLKKGVLPIYEPGLEDLVERNVHAKRLSFTTDLKAGLAGSKVVFIGVGTPQGEDGSADLKYIWSAVESIRDTATESKIVTIKSTVPVGTNAEAQRRLNEKGAIRHHAISNPEFLKEGCAVEDFMKPDRVVVGVREPAVAETMRELYKPFLRSGKPFLVMSPESAEMTKYVANAMLATKISFINEMANLCEKLNADINDVRTGIGHDTRIGFQFLYPGVGYGGSCFPKDIRAILAMSKKHGATSQILQAVDDVNTAQKSVLLSKIHDLLGTDLSGKTIAVWGLAFKPRTDDIREAPSLTLIDGLLRGGATVRVHDPEAMANVREVFGDKITYCDAAEDVLDGADALAIVTEWQQFRTPDFEAMRARMRQPIIVDGRNLYDPALMAPLGFTYASIGRGTAR